MPPAVLRMIAPSPRLKRRDHRQVERRADHRACDVRVGEREVRRGAARGSTGSTKNAISTEGSISAKVTAAKTTALRPEHRQPLRHGRERRADHARRVLGGDHEHAEHADRELRDLRADESRVERR